MLTQYHLEYFAVGTFVRVIDADSVNEGRIGLVTAIDTDDDWPFSVAFIGAHLVDANNSSIHTFEDVGPEELQLVNDLEIAVYLE